MKKLLAVPRAALLLWAANLRTLQLLRSGHSASVHDMRVVMNLFFHSQHLPRTFLGALNMPL